MQKRRAIATMLIFAVYYTINGKRRGFRIKRDHQQYVVERTREFGIMRSLGASRGTIMQNIIVEACMITAINYLFAAILALPLPAFIGHCVGKF